MADIAQLLAPNPGPMTLDGTNTWVVDTAAGAIVIDPGPDLDAHLDALLAAVDRVGLVLLTHHHADHTGLVDRLVARTSAPARAVDPAWCRSAAPLRHAEVIGHGGVELEVLHTPGHTADSACFVLAGSGPRRLFAGDTVLGRGSTVLLHPDGRLDDYLRTLDRLQAVGADELLPGHGPVVTDPAAQLGWLRAHRLARLAEVRQAREEGHTEPADIVRVVYGDLPDGLRGAAERSAEAQLVYLSERDA